MKFHVEKYTIFFFQVPRLLFFFLFVSLCVKKMEPVMSYRKRWIGSAIASMRHHAEVVNLEQHYYCKASKLSASWVQLHYDEECHRFVESCEDVSWTQTFAASCLMSCFGWSVTDTNGFLNRGQMHVLSTLQFRQLLS